LNTLVDSKGTRPAIDTAYFPNTQSSFYCSSTTDADGIGVQVDFGNGPDYGSGNGDTSYKFGSNYVRAVRGAK
jgi:hypothetical protein